MPGHQASHRDGKVVDAVVPLGKLDIGNRIRKV